MLRPNINAALTDQELSTALRKARVAKPLTDRDEFRNKLNEALSNYVASRYTAARNASPSAQLTHLRKIDSATQRLLGAINPEASAAAKSAWREIGRASLRRKQRMAALFGPQPSDESVLYGREKIRETIEFLRELAAEAAKRPEGNVAKSRKAKGRYHGDKAMQQLFGDLTSEWLFHFHEIPRIRSSAATRYGPFISFVMEVFRIYSAKLPKALDGIDRSIRKDLAEITPDAIAGRYRNSGVSRLIRIAKSDLKQN